VPQYPSVAPLLDLAGRTRLDFPVQANRGMITAAVVQHLEDGIEDGHEIMFQLPAAQLQYRCFLETMLAGPPRIQPPTATSCD
jgi:hypothetical protein